MYMFLCITQAYIYAHALYVYSTGYAVGWDLKATENVLPVSGSTSRITSHFGKRFTYLEISSKHDPL